MLGSISGRTNKAVKKKTVMAASSTDNLQLKRRSEESTGACNETMDFIYTHTHTHTHTHRNTKKGGIEILD